MSALKLHMILSTKKIKIVVLNAVSVFRYNSVIKLRLTLHVIYLCYFFIYLFIVLNSSKDI